VREDGTTLDELGRGAMGITYRALDLNLDSPVALKVISAAYSDKPEARERFRREARVAAQLRHPNVASVFHFGETTGGECFYAMELVEGETLEARVRRDGQLNVSLALDVAEQVCRALIAAETHGLVHRDLKPSNLMTIPHELSGTDSLLVKVIDFGLAKAVVALEDHTSQPRFSGTPEFASPEQFDSNKASMDSRSDIYSLGATLWYLLCGKVPFSGDIVTLRDHQRQLPLEHLTAANVPAPLANLLRSMLATNPDERPQSARELLKSLRVSREAIEVGPRRRQNLALAAAVLALSGLGIFGLTSYLSHRSRSQGAVLPAPEKSIAVLPFEDLNADNGNSYFVGGVQDEILSDLAKIADLKVISRTSVSQYRGDAPRNVREIGRTLGVAHVLEGSVQRVANRARVNAQLIDTRTDAHLWAQTYDRDLADVFAIETEIAQAIANELQAKLSPTEKVSIAGKPTQDIAAYDFYVRATPLIEPIAYSSTPEKDLFTAVALLNQAVARDPSFFLAYCRLAAAHDQIYFQEIDRTPARLAMAKSAIDAAFQLKPDSGEAHFALATHLYYGYFDYDHARAELALAQQALPNNAEVLTLAGLIDRRQSRWSEAVHNFKRASELDPRSAFRLITLATTYSFMRDYEQVHAALTRILSLEPKNIIARIWRASIELDRNADTWPFREEIEKILAEDPAQAENENLKPPRFWLALFERDFAAVDRAVAALPRQNSVGSDSEFSRDFWIGLVARMKGDTTAAQVAFTRVRVDREKQVQAQPDNGPFLSGLGVIDAALGRKEEALREGRQAIQLTPLSKNSLHGFAVLTDFAMICTWTGEYDLALRQLEELTRIPGGPSYGDLRLSPIWDPLRGDPRFEKIVASLAPKNGNSK
jgi:serine/threonine protein kinase/cytochrome c-type biogenesis protein CcmH/NrfG